MPSLRFIGCILAFGVLAFPSKASPQTADPGATLSWNAVRGQPGWATYAELACQQPDASRRLFATFTSPTDIPDFIGIDATVDLGYFVPPRGSAPPLAPFWHFEQGGCNETGLEVLFQRPSSTNLPTAWMTGVYFFRVVYAPDYMQPGLGRLQISIYRSPPIAIEAGTEYFAFTADLATCLGEICSGCDEWLGAQFSRVRLVGLADVSGIDVPQSGGHFVCINSCMVFSPLLSNGGGGTSQTAEFLPVSSSSTACEPTPVRQSTWGEVKVVYR